MQRPPIQSAAASPLKLAGSINCHVLRLCCQAAFHASARGSTAWLLAVLLAPSVQRTFRFLLMVLAMFATAAVEKRARAGQAQTLEGGPRAVRAQRLRSFALPGRLTLRLPAALAHKGAWHETHRT